MSGGDLYRVNWVQQAEAASMVNGTITVMETQLADLNSQINNLMATWDSDAQEAYRGRQEQWNSASSRIKEALSAFVNGLNSAADTSQGTEQTNVGVVSA